MRPWLVFAMRLTANGPASVLVALHVDPPLLDCRYRTFSVQDEPQALTSYEYKVTASRAVLPDVRPSTAIPGMKLSWPSVVVPIGRRTGDVQVTPSSEVLITMSLPVQFV